MKTRKTHIAPKSSTKFTSVFTEATTVDTEEMGVTLRIGDETLRKLDEIQEETTKAAQENQIFAWR